MTRDLFEDRARDEARRRHPSARRSDPTPIQVHFSDVVRGLAERHNITEQEVIEKLRGKVRLPGSDV